MFLKILLIYLFRALVSRAEGQREMERENLKQTLS